MFRVLGRPTRRVIRKNSPSPMDILKHIHGRQATARRHRLRDAAALLPGDGRDEFGLLCDQSAVVAVPDRVPAGSTRCLPAALHTSPQPWQSALPSRLEVFL